MEKVEKRKEEVENEFLRILRNEAGYFLDSDDSDDYSDDGY